MPKTTSSARKNGKAEPRTSPFELIAHSKSPAERVPAMRQAAASITAANSSETSQHTAE